MFVGFAGVYAAALDETGDTPKYSEGFKVGEGIATSIIPQYAEGSVYGDNRVVKHKKKFKNATVTLGVTTVPVQAEEVMFGRKVSEDGSIISNSKDQSKYIGLGFFANEEAADSNSISYVAVWLYKAKLEDPGDEFETEGENITFKTPSLSGIVNTLENGNWRKKKKFESEEDAVAWIKTMAGITPGTGSGGQGGADTGKDDQEETGGV